MKTLKLFLCCLTISIIVSYTFTISYNFFFPVSSKIEDDLPLPLIFIFAPLIETLIFQYTAHNILNYFKFEKDWIYIILMSLTFSLVHFSSLYYILMVFCSSISLNLFFIKTSKRDKLVSFLLTALFHSLYNLFGYLFVL